MITKTIFSEGKDNFADNVFSSSEWSAPIMVSPDDIKSRIDEMNLVGRKIKNVRIVGFSYWHTKERVEDSAYESLPDDMQEEERQRLSDYENIPWSLELIRNCIIDEPFLILFEDGDVFEIDTPQTPEYRFSMNCVPWNIQADAQNPNVDAAILFKPFLGRRIVEVEVGVERTDTASMLMTKHEENESCAEIVTRIVLWLEGDIGICINGWIDFCDIACIDRSGEAVTISFGELRRGLYND